MLKISFVSGLTFQLILCTAGVLLCNTSKSLLGDTFFGDSNWNTVVCLERAVKNSGDVCGGDNEELCASFVLSPTFNF